ncbi:MAG: hypothetical protein ACLU3I_11240 [Acutalibacteraceae bacterium]
MINVINILSLPRQAKIQEYQAIVDFTNEQLSSISIATAQKKADARQMIQEIEAGNSEAVRTEGHC